MTKPKAVIDVGSNSIKLYATRAGPGGVLETLTDRVTVTALAAGLERRGRLSAEAMERSCRVICGFLRTAEGLGCREIRAVGTMALRAAENRQEFLARVRKACGLDIEIIPGREEARLAYLGASGSFPFTGDPLVFDIGGGSTEFMTGRAGKADRLITLSLGALTLTEKYLASDPPLPREIRDAGEAIQALLEEGGLPGEVEGLIGIGGTLTTMGSVQQELPAYDPVLVHGFSLTRREVREQIRLFAGKTLAERRLIPGMAPDRAPVILAGALTVGEVMESLSAERVYISDRGLRHGVMEELFSGEGTIFQETEG